MINELREIFKDDSFKISLGLVERVHISPDRVFLRGDIRLIPDNLVIMAEISSDSVGGESVTLPNKDDLVLVVFTDDKLPIVLKKFYSKSDKIPKNAITGDTVLKSLLNKKLWLESDTRINIGNGEVEPTENLVLGQVFKTFCTSFLTILADKFQADSEHMHIGNLGIMTSPTNKATVDIEKKTAINELKSSPIGDNAILSDLAYTEKGE